MEEILTIEGMKVSTAKKIMKYKSEGCDVEEISRKTRVGIEKIEKVLYANNTIEAIEEAPESKVDTEFTIEDEIEIEESELTPDSIISKGVDSKFGDIITMQPKTSKAGKAKEKKSPKLDQTIISMSDLPGKGRKR